MPNADRRWATSVPTRPRPTTPSTLPCSSTPSQRERSHFPATRAAWAWGMLRAIESSRATACSAADSTFDVGAFTTMTPRRVAAATSTLSSPIPARPTTMRSRPASSTSAVTWVSERMISAAAPGTAWRSSAGVRPIRMSTSWPASRRRTMPRSAIVSETRTLAIPPWSPIRRPIAKGIAGRVPSGRRHPERRTRSEHRLKAVPSVAPLPIIGRRSTFLKPVRRALIAVLAAAAVALAVGGAARRRPGGRLRARPCTA